MTGQEWRDCTDPDQILSLLANRLTDRKLRLFARAIVGRLSVVLREPQTSVALDALQKYAEGQLLPSSLADFRQSLQNTTSEAELRVATKFGGRGSRRAYIKQFAHKAVELSFAGNLLATGEDRLTDPIVTSEGEEAISAIIASTSHALAVHQTGLDHGPKVEAAEAEERKLYSFFAQDIFGNLEHTCDSGSFAVTPREIELAQSIYQEQTFEDMPILGDALEDAGCDHAGILEHCRSDCTHVRGCWVLDLILARE